MIWRYLQWPLTIVLLIPPSSSGTFTSITDSSMQSLSDIDVNKVTDVPSLQVTPTRTDSQKDTSYLSKETAEHSSKLVLTNTVWIEENQSTFTSLDVLDTANSDHSSLNLAETYIKTLTTSIIESIADAVISPTKHFTVSSNTVESEDNLIQTVSDLSTTQIIAHSVKSSIYDSLSGSAIPKQSDKNTLIASITQITDNHVISDYSHIDSITRVPTSSHLVLESTESYEIASSSLLVFTSDSFKPESTFHDTIQTSYTHISFVHDTDIIKSTVGIDSLVSETVRSEETKSSHIIVSELESTTIFPFKTSTIIVDENVIHTNSSHLNDYTEAINSIETSEMPGDFETQTQFTVTRILSSDINGSINVTEATLSQIQPTKASLIEQTATFTGHSRSSRDAASQYSILNTLSEPVTSTNPINISGTENTLESSRENSFGTDDLSTSFQPSTSTISNLTVSIETSQISTAPIRNLSDSIPSSSSHMVISTSKYLDIMDTDDIILPSSSQPSSSISVSVIGRTTQITSVSTHSVLIETLLESPVALLSSETRPESSYDLVGTQPIQRLTSSSVLESKRGLYTTKESINIHASTRLETTSVKVISNLDLKTITDGDISDIIHQTLTSVTSQTDSIQILTTSSKNILSTITPTFIERSNSSAVSESLFESKTTSSSSPSSAPPPLPTKHTKTEIGNFQTYSSDVLTSTAIENITPIITRPGSFTTSQESLLSTNKENSIQSSFLEQGSVISMSSLELASSHVSHQLPVNSNQSSTTTGPSISGVTLLFSTKVSDSCSDINVKRSTKGFTSIDSTAGSPFTASATTPLVLVDTSDTAIHTLDIKTRYQNVSALLKSHFPSMSLTPSISDSHSFDFISTKDLSERHVTPSFVESQNASEFPSRLKTSSFISPTSVIQSLEPSPSENRTMLFSLTTSFVDIFPDASSTPTLQHSQLFSSPTVVNHENITRVTQTADYNSNNSSFIHFSENIPRESTLFEIDLTSGSLQLTSKSDFLSTTEYNTMATRTIASETSLGITGNYSGTLLLSPSMEIDTAVDNNSTSTVFSDLFSNIETLLSVSFDPPYSVNSQTLSPLTSLAVTQFLTTKQPTFPTFTLFPFTRSVNNSLIEQSLVERTFSTLINISETSVLNSSSTVLSYSSVEIITGFSFQTTSDIMTELKSSFSTLIPPSYLMSSSSSFILSSLSTPLQLLSNSHSVAESSHNTLSSFDALVTSLFPSQSSRSILEYLSDSLPDAYYTSSQLSEKSSPVSLKSLYTISSSLMLSSTMPALSSSRSDKNEYTFTSVVLSPTQSQSIYSSEFITSNQPLETSPISEVLSTKSTSVFESPRISSSVTSSTQIDRTTIITEKYLSTKPPFESTEESRQTLLAISTELPSILSISPTSISSWALLINGTINETDYFTVDPSFTGNITNETIVIFSSEFDNSTLNMSLPISSTPLVSSSVLLTTPEPEPPKPTTANITTSKEAKWVKTVLKVQKNIKINNEDFIREMEARFAEAYNEAFVREKLMKEGKFQPLDKRRRKKRYTVVGDAAVHIHDMTREDKTTVVTVAYSVEKTGKVMTPSDAVTSLGVLDTQEMAIILKQVVRDKAEPYIPIDEPVTSEDENSQLMFIIMVVGPVVGGVIFIWLAVCIYVKCCKKNKRYEDDISEPELTSIEQHQSQKRKTSALSVPLSKPLPRRQSKFSVMPQYAGPSYETQIDDVQEAFYEDERLIQKSPTADAERGELTIQSKPSGTTPASVPPAKPQRTELRPPSSPARRSKNSIGPSMDEHDFRCELGSQGDRSQLFQCSFTEDTPEIQDHFKEEKQKIKSRMRQKYGDMNDTEVKETVLGMPNSSLTEFVIESGSEVKETKAKPNTSTVTAQMANNALKATSEESDALKAASDENMEEARNRMHKLLDEAFSLISPKSSFSEHSGPRNKESVPIHQEMKVNHESMDDVDEESTEIMPESSPVRLIQQEGPPEQDCFLNPSFSSSYSDFLETWSPYRPAGTYALISMPNTSGSVSGRGQTSINKKDGKNDKRHNHGDHRRPAANLKQVQNKKNRLIDDVPTLTKEPAKPIVIRTNDDSQSRVLEEEKAANLKNKLGGFPSNSITGLNIEHIMTGSTSSLSKKRFSDETLDIEMRSFGRKGSDVTNISNRKSIELSQSKLSLESDEKNSLDTKGDLLGRIQAQKNSKDNIDDINKKPLRRKNKRANGKQRMSDIV